MLYYIFSGYMYHPGPDHHRLNTLVREDVLHISHHARILPYMYVRVSDETEMTMVIDHDLTITCIVMTL